MRICLVPDKPARERWLSLLLALVAIVLSVWSGGRAHAQDVQPVPALSGRVIDQTSTLTEAQRQALERKLAAFEQEAGPQMVVLMVPSTAPEDIAAYAQRVGDQWKIGRRDVGDGLLIVVAKQDRRINIQTAKALEGAVPDLAARQIIERDITPAFRAGDYAGGLNRAVDSLQARIRGEHLPAPTAKERRSAPSSGGGFDFGGAAALFFIGVPIAGALLTAMMGRKLGSLATGGGAGTLGWLYSGSVLMGIGAGLASLVLVGVLGIGAARRRYSGGSSPYRSSAHGMGGRSPGVFIPPVIWGGGGGDGGSSWGGGDGGGFSSGGGGDFGGGGASGDW